MIEQTGSIFIECESCGAFKTSCFSDVYIRDINFNIKDYGKGLLQLLFSSSLKLPRHNIITEDEGEILKDNCKSCNQNKRFLVFGRAKNSEIRVVVMFNQNIEVNKILKSKSFKSKLQIF